MVWTNRKKVPRSNDKAGFVITAVLNWSLKSVRFSVTTTVSTWHSPLAWKVDNKMHFDPLLLHADETEI